MFFRTKKPFLYKPFIVLFNNTIFRLLDDTFKLKPEEIKSLYIINYI